jgi:DNA primase
LNIRQIIETIKANIDIVEVIGERIELNRHEKALCPFHDEKTPSFSVKPEGQYFHCFGCGAGGDVIDFVMKFDKVDFIEAIRILASRINLDLTDISPEAVSKMEAMHVIEEILAETANFYQKYLTDDVREYLVKQRGFSEETIIQFKLGFARGGLREHLINKRGFSQDVCQKAGVLKKNKNGIITDFFYKRIVFPNLRRGKVVYMTGRALNHDGPKYLNIPCEICHLFNEDALMNDRVVLVEGAPDCLTLVQNGFNAVGLLGASGFKPDYTEKFKSAGVVYICLDGDGPGRKSALEIGEMLADKAIIVEMPEGQDINDLFKDHSSEEYRALLDAGKSYYDIEIENIKSSPSNIHLENLTEFLPKLAGLGDFKRSHYIDIIKKDFGLSKKTIIAGINQGKSNQGETIRSSDDQAIKPLYTESGKGGIVTAQRTRFTKKAY